MRAYVRVADGEFIVTDCFGAAFLCRFLSLVASCAPTPAGLLTSVPDAGQAWSSAIVSFAFMLIDQDRDTDMQCESSSSDVCTVCVACDLTVTHVLLRGFSTS